MTEEKVVNIRRESIVSLVYEEGKITKTCKSYRPQDYAEYHQKFYPAEKMIFPKGEDQRALFKREVAVLQALAGLEKMLVPRLINIDDSSLKIYTEYVAHPTYQETMMNQPERRDELTKELIYTLIEAHNYCNEQIETIELVANKGGKNRLKFRSLEEETVRWVRYFETLIYHVGEEFAEDKRRRVPECDAWKARRKIKRLLRTKKVDLEKEVREFIRRSHKISEYGCGTKEKSLVFGDFSPQNVFCISPQEKRICLIDFDKARLGSRDIDLISAIYNIYRFEEKFSKEKEMVSLEMAVQYFRGAKIGQSLELRLAGFIASRLKFNLRFFAVYSKMTEEDMRSFLKGKTGYEELMGKELRDKLLGDAFMQNFIDFFNYYREGSGEGWELILRPADAIYRDLVKEQLAHGEELLVRTGILRGKISERSRQRFNRIVSLN